MKKSLPVCAAVSTVVLMSGCNHAESRNDADEAFDEVGEMRVYEKTKKAKTRASKSENIPAPEPVVAKATKKTIKLSKVKKTDMVGELNIED